jgi:6-pyruvoyltetrahydropterin/6-carboxytetrahydropterin synthase
MSSSPGVFRLQIRKEALKFSAAHMTVFADGTKENLHGHNYRTVLHVQFERFSLDEMLPFSVLKKEMRRICEEWDEKILLPSFCPFAEITSDSAESLEIQVCGKRYVFPRDEVVLLPVDTVTTESLAKCFVDLLMEKIDRAALAKAGTRSLEVQIEEMLGQGASYAVSL